jgi:hypothetical protein
LVVIAETLTFRKLFHCSLDQIGITIPVRLQWSGKQSVFTAKVDTGASCCIFARVHGEELGLDIEAGRSQRIDTVMGSFLTFAHLVTLSVLEISFETTVYFAEEASFNRNVLGQQGWLDRLRLGLMDYEGKLYLSDYNDAL